LDRALLIAGRQPRGADRAKELATKTIEKMMDPSVPEVRAQRRRAALSKDHLNSGKTVPTYPRRTGNDRVT